MPKFTYRTSITQAGHVGPIPISLRVRAYLEDVEFAGITIQCDWLLAETVESGLGDGYVTLDVK